MFSTYSTNKREDEPSTDTSSEVTYWEHEAGRNTLQRRVVG